MKRIKVLKKKYPDLIKEYEAKGIQKITESKKLFFKISWAIFFVASSACSIFFTNESIKNYLQYEVIQKTEIVYADQMIFPTITLCSDSEIIKNYKNYLSTCSFDLKNDCELNPDNNFNLFTSYSSGRSCLQFNSGKNMLNQSISIKNSNLAEKLNGFILYFKGNSSNSTTDVSIGNITIRSISLSSNSTFDLIATINASLVSSLSVSSTTVYKAFLLTSSIAASIYLNSSTNYVSNITSISSMSTATSYFVNLKFLSSFTLNPNSVYLANFMINSKSNLRIIYFANITFTSISVITTATTSLNSTVTTNISQTTPTTILNSTATVNASDSTTSVFIGNITISSISLSSNYNYILNTTIDASLVSSFSVNSTTVYRAYLLTSSIAASIYMNSSTNYISEIIISSMSPATRDFLNLKFLSSFTLNPDSVYLANFMISSKSYTSMYYSITFTSISTVTTATTFLSTTGTNQTTTTFATTASSITTPGIAFK